MKNPLKRNDKPKPTAPDFRALFTIHPDMRVEFRIVEGEVPAQQIADALVRVASGFWMQIGAAQQAQQAAQEKKTEA